MPTPLISVIVPVYKVEKYLAKCVDSIVNQTYKNLEIILVDDGSPDNCGKICDGYTVKDCRVKVIHKANGGLVSARNAGYDVITGEWHMYVDGDDWIELDTCEKLVDALDRHSHIDIIFWKFLTNVDGKSFTGKFTWKCNGEEEEYSDCVELARNVLVYSTGIASACCKLLNTNYAKFNGIRHADNLRQGSEGVEFSLRAFYYAKKALFINKYYNCYRYNPNSISKKIDEKYTEYLADCFDEMQKDINSFVRKDYFQKALYQNVLYGLVAIAMGTYFHPNNKDQYKIRSEKYMSVINKRKIFGDSIKFGSTKGMDTKRRFAVFFIKHDVLFMLDFISFVKQLMLRYGKFNY